MTAAHAASPGTNESGTLIPARPWQSRITSIMVETARMSSGAWRLSVQRLLRVS